MTLNDDAPPLHSVDAEVLPRKMRWFDGFAMAMTMPVTNVQPTRFMNG